jgi:hypothetical protein
MTAKITAAIRRKFARIERHQREVKRLVAECQAALVIGDVYDDDSYWRGRCTLTSRGR